MKKRITPDMIVEMVELAKQDVNITEIARRMNLDRTCVHRYLRIHYPDRIYQKHREVTAEELDTIRTMYLTQGMTPTDISHATGINVGRINHILTEYNIRKPKYGAHEISSSHVKMPEHIDDPLYYPERKVTIRPYKDRGKKYLDVSEVYGL